MELAIDTSTETASIALSSEGKVRAELTWHAGQNHTAELTPGINCLMQQSKSDIGALDGLIVASGPGSFNGLRVGMSLAKGLAFALGIPLVGIGTLEVEAYPYAAAGLPVCPIQNVGRGEIAAALFQKKRGKWLRIVEEHITTLNSLINGVRSQTVFCGRIPDETASQLEEKLGKKAKVFRGGGQLRRAGYLAELGWMRLKAGDFDHSPTLQPLYLRKPAITVSRKVQPRV